MTRTFLLIKKILLAPSFWTVVQTFNPVTKVINKYFYVIYVKYVYICILYIFFFLLIFLLKVDFIL